MRTTSFSRITSFNSCRRYYQYKYIDRLEVKEPFKIAFAKGSLIHGILELLIEPNSKYEPIEACRIILPDWLEDAGIAGVDVEDLLEFGESLAGLIYRTLPYYKGPEPIRNQDGSYPKDLAGYPPRVFTAAMKDAGLTDKRQYWDGVAAACNPAFLYDSFSFTIGYCMAWGLYFQRPEWLERTIAVEFPVSTADNNLVPFIPLGYHDGRFPDLYWKGYIDWVAESKDDRLVILDHKSGKNPPREIDVLHHPQLNLYVHLYHQLTGVWADVIGIHHVPTGQYLFARPDRDIVRGIVDYFIELQADIEQSRCSRVLPTDYNSPCLERDYKSGQVKSFCPYLQRCWPVYYESLQAELSLL